MSKPSLEIVKLWKSMPESVKRGEFLETLPESERNEMMRMAETILFYAWGDLPCRKKAQKLLLLAEGIELTEPESLINAKVFEDLTGLAPEEFLINDSEKAL